MSVRSALLLALLTALHGAGSQFAAAADTPIALFNQRDLEGWSTWLVDTGHDDPRRVFTVTNGLLRISGDGLGYLGTRSTHADYRLVVEWRWGSLNTAWNDRIGRARDSGIFLHATGPDGNSEDGRGAFMAAIECNLFQGATGDILLIRGRDTDGFPIAPRLTARVAATPDAEGWFTWKADGTPRTLERWGRLNWAGKSSQWLDQTDFRGPNDAEAPPGDWNRVECEARGRSLRIHVNGRLVNEAHDLSPSQGRILLQCEGSEIFFRRVEYTPLVNSPPRTASTVPTSATPP